MKQNLWPPGVDAVIRGHVLNGELREALEKLLAWLEAELGLEFRETHHEEVAEYMMAYAEDVVYRTDVQELALDRRREAGDMIEAAGRHLDHVIGALYNTHSVIVGNDKRVKQWWFGIGLAPSAATQEAQERTGRTWPHPNTL